MIEPAKLTTFLGNPDTRPPCDGPNCSNRGSITSDLWEGVLCGDCSLWAWRQAKGKEGPAPRESSLWSFEKGVWLRSEPDWVLELELIKDGWIARLYYKDWTSWIELTNYAEHQAKTQAVKWAVMKMAEV